MRFGRLPAITVSCLALWGLVAAALAQEAPPHMDAVLVLEIHFEDDHSGSFFHLAETLELDEPHALVLFDSHSDASAVPRSDDVRRQLREVRTLKERSERLEKWRREGRVQVFNWIEPLMPLPFESVWWLAPEFEGDTQVQQSADEEADEFLDARIAFEKRECGSFGERFHVLTLDQLEEKLPADLPVIASLDLDYFMRGDLGVIAAEFEKIWSRIVALPNLHVVTISLSRPWLRDDAQAQLLTELALQAALDLKNATLRFEPFAPRGRDRSEMAKRLAAEGKVPERLDISRAPHRLRQLLLHNAERIEVRYENERWRQQLDEWRAESGEWRIVVDDHSASVDRIWRVESSARPALRVRTAGGKSADRVRWIRRHAERDSYDILPDWDLGKKFVEVPAPLIRISETLLGETRDGALAATKWRTQLDAKTAWGTIDLVAEVAVGDEWHRTPAITVRVFENTRGPFAAALSEQFGLPYVFGAGLLRQGGVSGPETGVGNDCANFLVYAWRRCGYALPWSNPTQLRQQLETIAEGRTLGEGEAIQISTEQIEAGLVIDCNSHMAALWEDTTPVGVLDGGDRVVHHLGGVPECISLSELLAGRDRQSFALRRLARETRMDDALLRIGGDICLAGETKFSPAWSGEGVTVANLETALTSEKVAAQSKHFLFRAPPVAAEWLAEAGITAVSLANNHSFDFGEAGLHETVHALEKNGVGHFGSMTRMRGEETWQMDAWRLKVGERHLAFFGVNLIEVVTDDAAGKGDMIRRIAELPRDQDLLAAAIQEAKKQIDVVIVMPHWGEEYVAEPGPSQRHWARWLIERGVDAVVGAHSHRLQPLDFYQGCPVFFSVGNLYFPGDNGPPGFHDAHWALFELNDKGGLRSARVAPVLTKARESSAQDREEACLPGDR